MVRNPPRGSPRVVARLAYDDPDTAVEFLEKAFGFNELEDARISGPEGIQLTELTVFDSKIMVGRAGAHGLVSPRSLGGYTQALIVYLDNVDQHFRKSRDAGAEIVSVPEDQFWGDRRYEAKDIEGHHWSFHEHVRDISAEEMQDALRALSGDA